jgi:hypothetical protein
LYLNVLLIGVILGFTTVMVQIIQNFDPVRYSKGCMVNVYVGGAAFSLIVGALNVRIYRLNIIFLKLSDGTRKVPRTSHLMFGLIGLLAVDWLIVSLWAAMDPLMMQKISGQMNLTYLYGCRSHSNSFYIAIACWRGFLLLFSTLLAYWGRAVPDSFDEKRSVAFLIYNMTFFGILYLYLQSILQTTVTQILVANTFIICVPLYGILFLWVALKFYNYKTKSDEELRGKVDLELKKEVSKTGSSGTVPRVKKDPQQSSSPQNTSDGKSPENSLSYSVKTKSPGPQLGKPLRPAKSIQVATSNGSIQVPENSAMASTIKSPTNSKPARQESQKSSSPATQTHIVNLEMAERKTHLPPVVQMENTVVQLDNSMLLDASGSNLAPSADWLDLMRGRTGFNDTIRSMEDKSKQVPSPSRH